MTNIVPSAIPGARQRIPVTDGRIRLDTGETIITGTPAKFNPIVEKAIREQLKKPTGELTKADLEKVKALDFSSNKLTSVNGLEKLTQLTMLNLEDNQLTDVKGLENLTKLNGLHLSNNPALTKAQIDELKKALPNCYIGSNPTK